MRLSPRVPALLFATAAWLLLAGGLQAAPETLPAPAVLRVGMPENLEFSAERNGLLRELYRRAGLNPEFVPLPLRRSTVMLRDGKLDAEYLRSQMYFDANADLLKVEPALARVSYWVHSRAPCGRPVDWAVLGKARVVYQIGTQSVERQLPERARVPVNLRGDALSALMEGRADYAVLPMTRGMLRSAAREFPSLCASKEPLFQSPLFHGLAPRHAGLLPRLAAAARSLQQDGSIDKTQSDLDSKDRHWSLRYTAARPASAPSGP